MKFISRGFQHSIAIRTACALRAMPVNRVRAERGAAGRAARWEPVSSNPDGGFRLLDWQRGFQRFLDHWRPGGRVLRRGGSRWGALNVTSSHRGQAGGNKHADPNQEQNSRPPPICQRQDADTDQPDGRLDGTPMPPPFSSPTYVSHFPDTQQKLSRDAPEVRVAVCAIRLFEPPPGHHVWRGRCTAMRAGCWEPACIPPGGWF